MPPVVHRRLFLVARMRFILKPVLPVQSLQTPFFQSAIPLKYAGYTARFGETTPHGKGRQTARFGETTCMVSGDALHDLGRRKCSPAPMPTAFFAS
jgi:hypothetical protein